MSHLLSSLLLLSSLIPSACIASDDSAPFIINGKSATVSEAVMEEYAAAYKEQVFPIPLQTQVPTRLQPLVMDFVVMLSDSEEAGCSAHTVTNISQTSGNPTPEIWTIQACDKQKTFRVYLKPCNNFLNNPYVMVTRNPPDKVFLAGKDPLDAIMLVSCPDE